MLPAICGRVCPQENQCEKHGVCGIKGEPVGIGTEVFDNVVFRAITDDEVAQFERLRFGQDFGWYPDPWAVTGSEWRPGGRALLTFCEDGANKLPPDGQAERVKALLTWDGGDGRPAYHHLPVLSDDADPTAIAVQRDHGVNARAAGKGKPGRMASYRFLQSLSEWVIDPERCPRLAAEVRALEYAQTPDGEVLNEIPDGNDHWVDATRYATMDEARRARGYRKVA